MPADQIPGLGQRTADRSIDQNGGCPERSDQHGRVGLLEIMEIQEGDAPIPRKAPIHDQMISTVPTPGGLTVTPFIFLKYSMGYPLLPGN